MRWTSSVNPYGHAAIRYSLTTPSAIPGEPDHHQQIVMNIVGVKGAKMCNFMSPDEYSLVFRVLYSSTYLSERYSEKALNLLSQAHYKGALVAGVPAGITVAHKFGDTTVANSPELHDCGVVYVPNDPYLICVMTKGSSFAGLQDTIKSVSANTYQQFTAINSK